MPASRACRASVLYIHRPGGELGGPRTTSFPKPRCIHHRPPSPQIGKLALDEALAAEAFLLGRRTYEWLAARWPSRSGGLADRLNGLPKYVVSATLHDPAWNNSTVLAGDARNEVSKLRQELNGEIVIPGSFQLVRTLLEHGLVDELRLKIFPVALGTGERLFGETSDKTPLRLIDAQTVEGGIAYLIYQPVRDA